VPRVVARIRDEISRSAQTPKPLEVAVGTAIHEPGAPQDVDDLLAAADRDMYDVKRSEQARFSG
jgi:GGDEF domain-containing protein